MKQNLTHLLKVILGFLLITATLASAIATVMTILPDSSSSKPCLLGYKAHCSFTPISSLILLIISLIFAFTLHRTITKKINQK